MKLIKLVVTVVAIITATVVLISCEEENSIKFEDGTELSSYEKGDDFIDEDESYILSATTQSSTVLPYNCEGIDITYRIRNSSDLKLFIEQVNNGEFEKLKEKFMESSISYSFKVELEHDITIDENYVWQPIGTGEYPMNMIFDGKGHTISGTITSIGSRSPNDYLYLEDGSQKPLIRHGFFGFANGGITNLNINADLRIATTAKNSAVMSAILVAQSECNVENVTVSGKLTTPIFNQHCDYLYHGHIVGMQSFGWLKNCSSKGSIELSRHGSYSYSIQAERAYIGGIIGNARDSGIERTNSSVEINISDATVGETLTIGGIVGLSSSNYIGSPSIDIHMLEVENKGDIIIETPHKLKNNDNAAVCIGGIIGNGAFRINSGKIINSGSIYLGSTSMIGIAGGVVGYYNDMYAKTDVLNSGNIQNHAQKSITGGCYGQVADVEPTIEHAFNSGDISASEVELILSEDSGFRIYGLVGGIVGKATVASMGLLSSSHRSGSIHQCSNSGNVQSGGSFIFNGLECETAGSISGDGYSIFSCNNSYGTINGETSYPWKYNGTTWSIKEKLDNGEMSEENEYWYFWKDFKDLSYGYTCDH